MLKYNTHTICSFQWIVKAIKVLLIKRKCYEMKINTVHIAATLLKARTVKPAETDVKTQQTEKT
jgi:hypothetical protein